MKFVNPECRATSPNREIPATLVRPDGQNAPGKVDKPRRTDYTQGKAALQDQVARFYLRPALVPSWCSIS